jgi:hypothetical protein
MDYASGEGLGKLQWDLIHDPGLVVNLFETDKGAEMAKDDIAERLANQFQAFSSQFPQGVYLALHGFSCDLFPKSMDAFVKQNFSLMDNKINVLSTSYYIRKEKSEPVIAIFYTYSGDTFNGQIKQESAVLSKSDLQKKIVNLSSESDFLEFYTRLESGEYKALKKCDNWADLRTEICTLISSGATNISAYCTDVIDKVIQCPTKKIMIFVNGYRQITTEGLLVNRETEFPDTENNVMDTDEYSYWGGIDQQFIDRRKSDLIYYLDGHMGIQTSNHRDMETFAKSLRSSYCARYPIDEVAKVIDTFIGESPLNPIAKLVSGLISEYICPDPEDGGVCYHNSSIVKLSTNPNKENGFDIREQQGFIAGGTLYARLIKDKVAAMDTIDIVCHIMGFAYVQGVLRGLKTVGLQVGHGGYYIIAPEDACSGEINVNDWKQIWQYGTDENHTEKWMQDGIAPQCPVGNIGTNRAFIPDDAPHGFTESH